jgi:hypothetical protein
MFSIAKFNRLRLGALLLLVLLASCGGGRGFTGTGSWWNPAEPGTGIFVEAQGDVASASLFVFAEDGRPVWYNVVDSLRVNAAGKFEIAGTLHKFHGGQSVGSSVPRAPTATAIGPISIVFDGNDAVVQVPGRRFKVTKVNPGAPSTSNRKIPETGILWNPKESGRAYTAEVVNGLTWLTVYHYDEAGEPTWNLVTGKLVNGRLTADWLRYEGGQTLAGPYRAARLVPTGAQFKAAFSSACEATLTFPEMAETPVRRVNFGGLPAGDECRSRVAQQLMDPRIAFAVIKLVLLFALVLVAGLSLSPPSNPEPGAFVARMLIGSAMAAWVGLIVTYLVPVLRPAGFLALLAWLIVVWRRHGMAGIVQQLKPARAVLAVQLLACLLVLSMGYLYGGFADPFQAAVTRWIHWSTDSAMPSLALKRLVDHDLSLMWGWQVSDRPPLQSGFINLLLPFGRASFDHLLVGIVCQSLAIPGSYLLLRALNVSHRRSIAALALFATSGFFLMNGFFTWPKLISFGYLAAAAALLLSRDPSGRRYALLAGVLAGLGCLAHGGGAFALFGMLIVAACGSARRRIPWMMVAFLLTVLPWILFTKLIDPPGDRLGKWHLAGIVTPDARGLPQTVIDSYRSRTLEQVVTDKLENVRRQIGEADMYRSALQFGSKSWWEQQFGILAFACFPAWLGVVALLFRNSRSALAGTLPLHLLWLAALAVTCVMMFGPALDVDATVATAYPSLPQQSYFVPALALIGAALALLSLPSALRVTLIVMQLVIATLPYFFPPVWAPEFLFTARPSIATLLVAAASLGALAWLVLRPVHDRQETPEGRSATQAIAA